MTEIALPRDKFTAQTHVKSLEGLVDRYEHAEEPIHYKKAATDIGDSTASSCLKYFKELGLIIAEKQGVYVPSQPSIDYFTKIRKSRLRAIEKIASILRDDEVFKEVTFHLGEGQVELDELAKKTAGGLDLNKEKISQIERAIEVFAELEALSIDEEGLVTLKSDADIGQVSVEKESENIENEKLGEESQEGIRAPSEIDLKDIDLSPTRGDPESLHQVCIELKAGGKWTLSEIAEETGFAERTARGHIKYGIKLGFISRSDEEITPTERGYDFGFEPELNETTEELFLQAVLESDFYLILLSRCLDRVEDEDKNPSIKSSHCERELRTYFGFTGESESTLRDAINTFLQTIQATGHGEYLVGRRGSETRVEFTKKSLFDLNRVIQTKTIDQPTGELETQTTSGSKEGDQVHTGETEEKRRGRNDGPPLRISSLRIQNFRNIQDTSIVRLEPITTFIGKNESGKTSTLEAIHSFTDSEEYPDRDICNDINYSSKAEIPIISLTFEITEEVIKDYYPDAEVIDELPLEYSITKFADGSKTEDPVLGIENPPSPDIVYYNDYDLVSDVLYFDDEDDGGDENKTFWNLLEIGNLTKEQITETTGRDRDQAIEDAENEIERRLNEGWSQKDIRINLRYSDAENCIRLYIQDELKNHERDLTLPSQRSEGFQWFFSFYVNMLAETMPDEDGYKVLLLDDPAVHLHPSGKQDWLDSLEEIAKEEQVLYTSHSPYLINKQYPSRIRTVEDSPDGTQINAAIFDADTGTLEPLRNALGIDMSSSPFISEGQVLVEGPTEYYILSAVGAYFENVLEREFIDWNKVSLMPVRGANDVIGKASWLESEELEYMILLDSDEEGQDVSQRINDHHGHINDDRVMLLTRRPHDSGVVIEDVFDPAFYVEAFNEFYGKLSNDINNEFNSISIEQNGHNQWEIGRESYTGQRIDEVLVKELERQDVGDELRNDDGEIELMKRQIAEIIADKINNNQIDPDALEYFNPVMADIDNRLEL